MNTIERKVISNIFLFTKKKNTNSYRHLISIKFLSDAVMKYSAIKKKTLKEISLYSSKDRKRRFFCPIVKAHYITPHRNYNGAEPNAKRYRRFRKGRGHLSRMHEEEIVSSQRVRARCIRVSLSLSLAGFLRSAVLCASRPASKQPAIII